VVPSPYAGSVDAPCDGPLLFFWNDRRPQDDPISQLDDDSMIIPIVPCWTEGLGKQQGGKGFAAAGKGSIFAEF
jgi:hypothetical protein